MSNSGRKPWTIVRRFDKIGAMFCGHIYSVSRCLYLDGFEGATVEAHAIDGERADGVLVGRDGADDLQ